MAVKVTIVQQIVQIINKRVSKQVENIKAANSSIIKDLREEATRELAELYNITEYLEEYYETKALIEDKQTRLAFLNRTIYDALGMSRNLSYHTDWTFNFDRKVTQKADDAFLKTEPGQRVQELLRLREDAEMIALSATSPTELRSAMEKINTAVGYVPTELEKELLQP